MFLPRLGVLYNYEHVPSSPYIMVGPQLKPLSRLFPIPSVQCTHIPRTFSPGKSRLQFFSLLYRMIAVWGVPLSAFFGAWCLPTLFAEYELQLRGQSSKLRFSVLRTPSDNLIPDSMSTQFVNVKPTSNPILKMLKVDQATSPRLDRARRAVCHCREPLFLCFVP